jgi:hypothetical protein
MLFDLTRTGPESVATRTSNSRASSTGPTKPTFVSGNLTTASDPFKAVFQSATQGNATSSSSTASATGLGKSAATTELPAKTTTSAITAETGTTAASTAAIASASAAPADSVQTPGIQALVSAITNGTFQAAYVTDPSQLKETTPIGTDTMPNFYYASDQTAQQLAQLLGGTVVQRPAFGQDAGWSEPNANFIQLPNGQTFNAADVAYYARSGNVGAAQLTADITQTINVGSAWTNWYMSGGTLPSFNTGYVGPPISGMTYPAGMIGADGMVVNPALQVPTSSGT